MKFKSLLSKLFGSSRAQLELTVANLIADGKIAEAVQVLLDAGHTEAALLKARWDILHAQQEKRPLNWETFSIAQSRILYALLETAKSRKARAKVWYTLNNLSTHSGAAEAEAEALKLTESQRSQLRALLEQDKWQEALNLGKDWSNDLILIHSRYKDTERQYHLGVISEEHYQISKQRILDTLHYLTGENP